ncbi:type II secretion system protein J [Magnetospira sp. QH-2]|uniref:PulJ/GspJ family protein n=1 Tax=Magnetospira sp. (strain QH-2) TaxID=1288970 RepID=UPI0003E81B55|nr:prepilin-type N-terminal cleavage/methylation domain-containing protein [Magnetospira sp. QH-2]CCQ73352.1 Exported protein of unknown function [Magnetospira sp. QH-2]
MIRADTGFTLMEMLVSLSVLALIMTLLSGSLHFGARAWEKGRMVLDRDADLRAVHRVLRRMVTETAPEVIPGDKGLTFAFSGTPNALEVNDWGFRLTGEEIWVEKGLQKSQLALSVVGARFAYLGAEGWQPQWPSSTRLPRQVRLWADGWPEIIVTPGTDADAACLRRPPPDGALCRLAGETLK